MAWTGAAALAGWALTMILAGVAEFDKQLGEIDKRLIEIDKNRAKIDKDQAELYKQLTDLYERLDQSVSSKMAKWPTLSKEGEDLRKEYLARLSPASPEGLWESDKCGAHFIALQQSERLKMRAEFMEQSKADHHNAAEINHATALDQQQDLPYALYVLISCDNGEKPMPYADFLKPKP